MFGLKRLGAVFVVVSCAWFGGFASAAESRFVGKYDGERLAVDVKPEGEGYGGEIRLGDRRFPMKARERDGRLEGTFSDGTSEFKFTATPRGDGLALETDGTTYAL